MAGLCEGGNEPPGSLKASKIVSDMDIVKLIMQLPAAGIVWDRFSIANDLKDWSMRSHPDKGNRSRDLLAGKRTNESKAPKLKRHNFIYG
ncbi:hypothetical protein ANN_22902 [Periplaneta americana]|uniref:Uncharacterized protein n=1 Tax=Periplaneta americana TaxID=6978 RepID=A0ABQ8SJZ0_PERAM|nr:hypothetical protein ANN_22902 [Periplaneta americana]